MTGDHRKTFRILTPAGREQAKLRVGKRQLSVRLVDESAGGFAVACPGQMVVASGEVLQLRTAGGLHEVRVIRREEFSDGVLLGFERLRDLDDPTQPAVRSNLFDVLLLPYVAGGPAGGGGFRWAWLFGLGLTAVGLLFVGNMLATYRPPQIEATLIPGTQQFVDKMSRAARAAAAERQAEREGLRPQKSTSAQANSAMGQLTRHWRQASSRIAASLGLSADQRRRIDAIAQSEADGASQDAQIRDVLTTDQADHWRQMQP
ncbi:MAG: PilZ domain-containing protein [Pirellulaceae bacterium]|nr:PilZ domain-containing protein [Pirellulaceae bacterium]